jgi:hypothetical protein
MYSDREKWAEYMRGYRKANPDIFKKIDLKKNYGLDFKEYQALLEEQDYVCAICKKPETKLDPRSNKPFALAVDHCHDSNAVRGLLCMKCNRGLGLFEDDPKLLQAALKYLGPL